MNKKTTLTLAIAATLLALAGCSSTDTTPPDNTGTSSTPPAASNDAAEPSPTKSAEPGVGTPFEVKQNDGTAKITIMSATYGPKLGSGPFDSEADNGGYLVLDVLWETAEGTSHPNPLYFKAKDADGREGDFAIFVDDSLGSGDVPAGDKSRGNVGFDIGAGPYTVIVTDQLLQEKARLTITAAPR